MNCKFESFEGDRTENTSYFHHMSVNNVPNINNDNDNDDDDDDDDDDEQLAQPLFFPG